MAIGRDTPRLSNVVDMTFSSAVGIDSPLSEIDYPRAMRRGVEIRLVEAMQPEAMPNSSGQRDFDATSARCGWKNQDTSVDPNTPHSKLVNRT